MTTITTQIVKDGNSMAVRLSKPVLSMSGLHGKVQLDVKRGQITLRAADKPRASWRQQIEKEIKAHGPPDDIDGYGNMSAERDATLGDGLK